MLSTDQEHPGGVRCWEYYQDRSGIEIDRAVIPTPPKSEQEIVDLLAAMVTPRTKIMSASHVTFTTGLRLPIAKSAELADAHKCLLVVDGARGAEHQRQRPQLRHRRHQPWVFVFPHLEALTRSGRLSGTPD